MVSGKSLILDSVVIAFFLDQVLGLAMSKVRSKRIVGNRALAIASLSEAVFLSELVLRHAINNFRTLNTA
jgi:hypothetical protein